MEVMIREKFDYWWSLADNRTRNWFFIETPWPILLILGAYYSFVFIGYFAMRKRKAFELRRTLVGYNMAMAVLNFWITFRLITTGLRLGYNFACEPSDVKTGDSEIIDFVWMHMFSKTIELMDTVFIVIRKTDRQLTFLHVYHHSSVLVFWWITLKWVPSGSPFLIAAVNSGVHIIMYINYALTASRRDLANSFWWKRYITIIQMVQFTTGMVMTTSAILSGCPFPMWMMVANILYLMSFFVLFFAFYQKTYPKFKLKEN